MAINASISRPEIRKLITASVITFLAHLPETQRNMFIWKHYHGIAEKEIAGLLKCSKTEVDNTLRQINSALMKQAGTVLAHSAPAPHSRSVFANETKLGFGEGIWDLPVEEVCGKSLRLAQDLSPEIRE